VRLEGPLTIDSIAAPVKLDSHNALSVRGTVGVDKPLPARHPPVGRGMPIARAL
jgi:hypothetical protein